MAVQFYLGAGGSGKTTAMYKKMIEQSMEPDHKPILFILPEQANMAAEQDMAAMHPMGGTMEISILSFTRLAFQVFDELNVHTRDILDDYGKSMLIMKLLKENEEQLTYYGGMVSRQGFVDEVKSVLSEFYQYRITEQVLDRVLESLSPERSLYHKLSDLRLLYQAFNQAMADSYMVTEQILSMLAEVAGDSKILREAEIYFDGFTGFTPVQYDVIGKLMELGGNLYFSFTMDEDIFGQNEYSEQGLFTLGKQSVDRLCRLAGDHRVPVLPHVGFSGNHRQKASPELMHMERSLFRFPVKAYSGNVGDIGLMRAKDVRQEAVWIARTIRRYVMEGGWHYRDFAIITGDTKEQAEVWRQAMEQSGVPCFLDISETLSRNPIVEAVQMFMDLFETDFSYDSVFTFLKSGFLEMDRTAVYDLENYALKYGVRGYSWWNRAFLGGVKGLHECNAIRKAFMEKLEKAAVVFGKKRALADEYIRALYDFLKENHMAEKLHEKSLWLEEKGRLKEAKAYQQVYGKWIEVLDKTMDILGKEEIAREDFSRILMTGIADMKLGVIPSTLDQVVIGDMERTRLHHIRFLFVAGANEGLLPANTSEKGILGDKDRMQLKEMNVELAVDSRQEIFLQQFYFYLQLTQAGERIFISYRQSDDKGAELRPSYFVSRIRQIFPGLLPEEAGEQIRFMRPATKEELGADFAGQLLSGDMTDSSAYEALKQYDSPMEERILDGFLYNNQNRALDKLLAKSLYGDKMQHSVSRLETYSGCAYQFFLQYGLSLRKREEYKVEANHIGTILHAVMENFFKGVRDGKYHPDSMTDEERYEAAKELTEAAAKEENETIFESSYRSRHQLEVLIRVAARSMENLCRHLEYGDMEPAFFEMKFAPEQQLEYIDMALKDGSRMELNGVVDRVDIRETEDCVYIKVIDYKSSEKDIDFVKMYEGKQLQLTVYMSVMEELLRRRYPGKRIVPTGMYYYHIQDPIIEAVDEDKLKQERIKAGRLSGLVNSAEESLQVTDGKTGTATPVNYNKDGKLSAQNSSLVTEEELQAVSDFVRKKMIEIGNDIANGRIDMNPEKGELNSPCRYCDYRSVCRFEAGIGGNEYRISCGLDKREAREKIMGGEAQGGDKA